MKESTSKTSKSKKASHPKMMTFEEQERCFALRNGGSSYQHIADVLGRDVKTVRNYLRKLEKEHDKEMLEHYSCALALRHAQLEEQLSRHWDDNKDDLKSAYFVTDTIQKLINLEGFTYRHLKELEREKLEKEEKKAKGLLIRLVDYSDPDNPVEKFPDGTTAPYRDDDWRPHTGSSSGVCSSDED